MVTVNNKIDDFRLHSSSKDKIYANNRDHLLVKFNFEYYLNVNIVSIIIYKKSHNFPIQIETSPFQFLS